MNTDKIDKALEFLPPEFDEEELQIEVTWNGCWVMAPWMDQKAFVADTRDFLADFLRVIDVLPNGYKPNAGGEATGAALCDRSPHRNVMHRRLR